MTDQEIAVRNEQVVKTTSEMWKQGVHLRDIAKWLTEHGYLYDPPAKTPWDESRLSQLYLAFGMRRRQTSRTSAPGIPKRAPPPPPPAEVEVPTFKYKDLEEIVMSNMAEETKIVLLRRMGLDIE